MTTGNVISGFVFAGLVFSALTGCVPATQGVTASPRAAKHGVVDAGYPLQPEVAALLPACLRYLESGSVSDLTSRGYKKLTERAYLKHVQPAVLRAGNVGSGLYQSSIDMSYGSCTVNVAKVSSATVSGLQVTQELQTAIVGQLQSAGYQDKLIPGVRGQTKTVWLKNGFAVTVYAAVSGQGGASSQAVLSKASASELSQAMAQ